MSYSTMVREMEQWSGVRITTKSWSLRRSSVAHAYHVC